MTGQPGLYYCYGVTRPFAPPPGDPNSVRGIADAPVEFVSSVDGELVAVVSVVPAEDFTEEALRSNLERLDWLDTVAHTHDAVVDWASRQAATAPFRLATLYRDEARVRAVLQDNSAPLNAALDRVDGRVELGLKAYAPAAECADPDPQPDLEDRPGSAYLKRRLAERRGREESWERAAQAADAVDRALGELADDRREHRPQSAQLSGIPEPNVRNVAYLVRRERVPEFLARAEALRESTSACRLAVTGPWAAYSFGPEIAMPTGTGA